MSLPFKPVVIVGAGPGGATTSLFLSKKKINHLILDKATFPRDKICGDALSGKVVEIAGYYDTDLIREFAEQQETFIGSWGVVFVAPNGKQLPVPFSLNPEKRKYAPGFISKRIHFDDFLVKKLNPAFAEIRLGTSLERIEKSEKGYILTLKGPHGEEKLETSLLIGAEGERSIVAKQLAGFKKELPNYCGGIRAYYKGVKDLHPQGFIELHFINEVLPGYLWVFPLPGGYANVGVGALSQTISDKKLNLKKALDHAIKTHPELSRRFSEATLESPVQGWGLPLGNKRRPLSGNHFLLIGDAGSLIDPFTGEGIGNAMKSAWLAADQVERSLKENRYDASFMQQYDDAVWRVLGDELRLSSIMQKLVKFPWLFNLVVNKALKNRTLRETISCMFEDLDMRARLRNPLFYFKLIFNRS